MSNQEFSQILHEKASKVKYPDRIPELHRTADMFGAGILDFADFISPEDGSFDEDTFAKALIEIENNTSPKALPMDMLKEGRKHIILYEVAHDTSITHRFDYSKFKQDQERAKKNQQLAKALQKKALASKDENQKGLENLPRIAGYFNAGRTIKNSENNPFDIFKLTGKQGTLFLTDAFVNVLTQLKSSYAKDSGVKLENIEETAEIVAEIYADLYGAPPPEVEEPRNDS